MIELVTSWITSLSLLVASVAQPTKARCPRGFVVVNIRIDDTFEPRGTFTCERPPIGGDTDVLTGKTTAQAQPGVLKGRLYCPDSSTPTIALDPKARTVRCSR